MIRKFMRDESGLTDFHYAGIGAVFFGGLFTVYLAMDWAFGDLLAQFKSSMSTVLAG
jgi:Flp pilus assembly pilin Flp